jgi:hypothetical protein
MPDLALIASILTAAGVGSVVGTLVTQSRDRRGSRARVLAAIAAVQDEEWRRPLSFRPFYAALHELNQAALIAGLPRSLLREYVAAASAMLHHVYNEQQADVQPRTLPEGLADYQSAAAAAMISMTWHPILGRLRWPFISRRLRRRSRRLAISDTIEGLRLTTW